MLDDPTAGMNEPPDTEQLLGEDFHAFPVAGGGVLFIPDSQIPAPQDQKTPDASSLVTQPLVKPSQPRSRLLVPYLLLAAHLLIVLFALSAQLYITLTETATITII